MDKALGAILVFFFVKTAVGSCSVKNEDLQPTGQNGTIVYGKWVNDDCTWSIPEGDVEHTALILNLRQVYMQRYVSSLSYECIGKLYLPELDGVCPGNTQCLIYASSSLTCNPHLVYEHTRALPKCKWITVKSLPRNITLRTTLLNYYKSFSLDYSFLACGAKTMHGEATLAETTTSHYPSQGNESTEGYNASSAFSSTSNSVIIPLVVTIFLLFISLLSAVGVIILLYRRLEKYKQEQLKTIVRYSRQKRETDADEHKENLAVDVEEFGEAEAGGDDLLHGQGASEPNQEELQFNNLAASTSASENTQACVYATVRKPI